MRSAAAFLLLAVFAGNIRLDAKCGVERRSVKVGKSGPPIPRRLAV